MSQDISRLSSLPPRLQPDLPVICTTRRMAEIVRIRKRPYVIGLSWTALQAHPRSVQDIERLACPYAVTHWITREKQIGTGFLAGTQGRYPSLAALVADAVRRRVRAGETVGRIRTDVSMPRLTTGIFALERLDGDLCYWLFAMYNGRLVGGYCDTFSKDPDVCREHVRILQEMYAVPHEMLVDPFLYPGHDRQTVSVCPDVRWDRDPEVNPDMQPDGYQERREQNDPGHRDPDENGPEQAGSDGNADAHERPDASERNSGRNTGTNADRNIRNDGKRDESVRKRDEHDDGHGDRTDTVVRFRDLSEARDFLEQACRETFPDRFTERYLVVPLRTTGSRTVRLIRRILGLLVCTGLLTGGGYYGWQVLEEMGGFELGIQQARRIEEKRQYYRDHPEELFPCRWNDMADPETIFSVCQTNLTAQPRLFHGWRLTGMRCRLTHGKTGTAVRLLADYAAGRNARYAELPGNCQVKKDARSMEYPQTIVSLQGHGSVAVSSLMHQEELRRRLLDCAGTCRIRCSIVFSGPESRTIDRIGAFACPWVTGRFELRGILPVQLASVCTRLSACTGIRVTEIGYAEKRYHLEGELYARP